MTFVKDIYYLKEPETGIAINMSQWQVKTNRKVKMSICKHNANSMLFYIGHEVMGKYRQALLNLVNALYKKLCKIQNYKYIIYAQKYLRKEIFC